MVYFHLESINNTAHYLSPIITWYGYLPATFSCYRRRHTRRGTPTVKVPCIDLFANLVQATRYVIHMTSVGFGKRVWHGSGESSHLSNIRVLCSRTTTRIKNINFNSNTLTATFYTILFQTCTDFVSKHFPSAAHSRNPTPRPKLLETPFMTSVPSADLFLRSRGCMLQLLS